MSCGCIPIIDAKLAERNTRVMLPIMLGADQTARPMIVTDQIETGRGKKKAVGLFATFCPFCGVPYGAEIPAPSDQEKLEGEYLVWSNEHSAWWGKDRCGYTRIIANAGRYSRAEALSIAGTRDGGWHVRKGNPDEIAIPEQDAIDQYADITRDQDATRARQAAETVGRAGS